MNFPAQTENAETKIMRGNWQNTDTVRFQRAVIFIRLHCSIHEMRYALPTVTVPTWISFHSQFTLKPNFFLLDIS